RRSHQGKTPIKSSKKTLDLVFSVIKKTGKILVMDRGYDAKSVIMPLLDKAYNFVIRLERQRHLIIEGVKAGWKEWEKVPLTHKTVIEKIKKNGKKKIIHYLVGIKKVTLPYKGYRDRDLWLLVMKKTGPGIGEDEGYSYFLGNLGNDIDKENALKEMTSAYGARWKIEEFHRQVKDNFNLESISLARYEALRNMVTIVLVVASFFVSVKFKTLMMGFIKKKMGLKELRKYLNECWRFIYYKVFEELSYIFNRIKFKRRVTYEKDQDTGRMQSLFLQSEGGFKKNGG
ncbi:MAG: transposase, partial [Acidobacteriota bacterium]|nr:transposase [Acidobacteriota bacterium]